MSKVRGCDNCRQLESTHWQSLEMRQTRVDLAVHPAKKQTGNSGKKLPVWDMNEVEEQSVGKSPWTGVQ